MWTPLALSDTNASSEKPRRLRNEDLPLPPYGIDAARVVHGMLEPWCRTLHLNRSPTNFIAAVPVSLERSFLPRRLVHGSVVCTSFARIHLPCKKLVSRRGKDARKFHREKRKQQPPKVERDSSSREGNGSKGSYVDSARVVRINPLACSSFRRAKEICAAPSISPAIAFSLISTQDSLACTSSQFLMT